MKPLSSSSLKPDNISSSAHEFAIFIPNLSKQFEPNITITDTDCITRISCVLRLKPGDHCILFDDLVHVHAIIKTIQKKYINITLTNQTKNTALSPFILMVLPILKREDLSDAVSMLTASGVSAIQLVYTEKTRRTIWSDKDMMRLERIIIAAAEQSKQFRIPKLYTPIPLSSIISPSYEYNPQKNTSIFFDQTGMPVQQVMQKVHSNNSLVFIVGPEGDLTPNEKELLHSNSVLFCMLTKTVLKASLAAALGVGVFRSLIN